jgi:CO/xanthine dehydrogenase FAD-binding subunit
MRLWQNFLRPNSVEEALQALHTSLPSTCIIAGGTDLMLDLQQGNHPPVGTLVDVTAIPALTGIEMREEGLFIGAVVPIGRVAGSPLVLEHAEALVEACRLIGGPQVRNVATLGGNVAHALPAADGSIALMCLDVQAEVAALTGVRRVPFPELFLGPGKSALKSGDELLVGFHIPLRTPGQASAFHRVMRAQGIALPILNLSAWLERKHDRITRIRIVPGPAGLTPRRMLSTEEVFIGNPLDEEVIERGLGVLLEEASFRTSPRRATVEYRRHLVGVLLKETLQSAWQRAGD